MLPRLTVASTEATASGVSRVVSFMLLGVSRVKGATVEAARAATRSAIARGVNLQPYTETEEVRGGYRREREARKEVVHATHSIGMLGIDVHLFSNIF